MDLIFHHWFTLLWQAYSPAFKSYKGNAEAEFQVGNQKRAKEVLLLPIRQRPKIASLIRQFRMEIRSDVIAVS
jgi:hypothetical protein